MTYIATSTDEIIQKTLGNTDTLIIGEDLDRLQSVISVTGGSVYVKLIAEADDTRHGILIHDGDPPWHLTPNTFVYTGCIFAINATAGETPVINLTEIKREHG